MPKFMFFKFCLGWGSGHTIPKMAPSHIEYFKEFEKTGEAGMSL